MPTYLDPIILPRDDLNDTVLESAASRHTDPFSPEASAATTSVAIWEPTATTGHPLRNQPPDETGGIAASLVEAGNGEADRELRATAVAEGTLS